MHMNVLFAFIICAIHAYSASGGQKRVLELLELELQQFFAAVWMLGIEH